MEKNLQRWSWCCGATAADAARHYGEVPYESYPFEETHLPHLHAVAVLAGLSPAPPAGCRVLEVGCASGSNIIPMAYYFPGSDFAGIDVAQGQISDGLQLIETLQLKNIRLHCRDFTDFEAPAPFDYIIAHGLFSWVSEEHQQELLRLAKRLLAPHGVFYVSYNALPGWHHKMALRDFLAFHTRRTEGAEAIRQARAALEILAQAFQNSANPHEQLLRESAAELKGAPDWYLYHEWLRGENRPVFFLELIERAAAEGLQYLGDADVTADGDEPANPDLTPWLQNTARDEAENNQYGDFFHNRMLRRSLLVPTGAALDRSRAAERLKRFRIASPLTPDSSQRPVNPAEGLRFNFGKRGSLVSHEPLLNAVLLHLSGIWPQNAAYPQLLELALRQVYGGAAERHRGEADRMLAESLHVIFTKGALKLDLEAAPCEVTPAERPKASRLARAQAEKGACVTGCRHQYVTLEEEARAVVRLLDGTRDCRAVYRSLADYLRAQKVQTPFKEFEKWFASAVMHLARKGILE